MLNESLKKFEESSNELTNVVKLAVFEEIDAMDDNTMRAIRGVVGFMKASTDLIREQATLINQMNEKLDLLLRTRP